MGVQESETKLQDLGGEVNSLSEPAELTIVPNQTAILSDEESKRLGILSNNYINNIKK